MKLENLKEGIVIKNYKVMCELLGEEVKDGSSKKAQLKEWKRYFRWDNEGQKFIIKEIYVKIKNKIDCRKGNSGTSEGSRSNNKKYFSNFKPQKPQWNDIGVYAITLGNDIYIGSTIAGFRQRFLHHNGKDNNIESTKEMLKNGGIFEILWISDVKDEDYVRFKENQFIKQYKKDKNWNVVNTNEAWNSIDGSKSIRKHTSLTKYIKIKSDNYGKAVKLLEENNLL